MRETILQKILDEKLIAIVRGMEEKVILPLAEAFIAGGLGMMEVTFNQAKPESFEATMRSIAAVKEKWADFIRAGALGFGVGGNLVNKDWIASGEFAKISDTARKLTAAVKS